MGEASCHVYYVAIQLILHVLGARNVHDFSKLSFLKGPLLGVLQEQEWWSICVSVAGARMLRGFLLIATAVAIAEASLQLQLLKNVETLGGRCLDGSPAGCVCLFKGQQPLAYS